MADKQLEEVLAIAIQREEEAIAFYQGLYRRVQDETAQDTLAFLAGEEKKHKEFLLNYRAGEYKAESLRMNTVVDYKIAEHREKQDSAASLESKDAYLVAAHRELASYNFYTSLAGIHPAGEVKDLLLKIAGEELRHKEKVEYLYANTAFPQTDGG
ncbi:MAG: ferritin family protein [Proteobacteria bacterium]|nr:ferritin family protein [Pseudomonadota bacterium]